MVALGNNLDTIVFLGLMISENGMIPIFEDATKFSPSIRRIEASGSHVQELKIISSILSAPKRKLKELIVFEDKGGNFSTLLKNLAENTGCLVQFSYTTFQIPEIDLFQDFAKRNPFLEIVTIRIDESHYRFEDFPLEILEYKEAVIINMIESFHCCRNLRELIIENPFSHFRLNTDRATRACFPFRNRKTFASICGVNFAS